VILVTNQSGIGRGFFTLDDFQAVQRRLVELLAMQGAHLDAVYHCPHSPDQVTVCDCRKPAPGLFLRAAAEHDVDLQCSFFVGDRMRDVEPATLFGASGFLVTGPDSGGHVQDVPAQMPAGVTAVSSLEGAVDMILLELSSD